MKALFLMLIFFGVLWCLLGGYYLWLKSGHSELGFKDYKPMEASQIKLNTKQSMPLRITISDLKIDLSIIPAKIENYNWETTDKGASYLTSSPIPGDTGNSIIYGHNWTNLFGNLTKAEPGQDIKIDYADGSQKKFVIESTSTVYPTASNILAESKDQRITLYTCTGFFDSKRFVAVAILDTNPSFADIRR